MREGLHVMTTAAQAAAGVSARLRAAGVPTPDVDAEQLLLAATQWSPTQFVLHRGEPLPRDATARLEAFTRRREQREPLQLIVGSVGFRHLEVQVKAGVFIPRPETEILVDEALSLVAAGGVVVEPCTGSGAVACAIATEADARAVIATDISPAAVELATENAVRAGAFVTVLCGDLFQPLPRELRGAIDVVVCNPPYLARCELANCAPEVADWDPVDALVAGATGYEITDRLIAEALQWLAPAGSLLIEVDSARARQVAQRALDAGFSTAWVVQDLAGSDRIVVGSL